MELILIKILPIHIPDPVLGSEGHTKYCFLYVESFYSENCVVLGWVLII